VRAAISHLNVNQDAWEDAALLLRDTATIQFLTGSAMGPALGAAIPVGGTPEHMVCGDILGLGNTDCVVVNSGLEVFMLIGNGAGSGVVVSIGQLAEAPSSMVLGDANDDGAPDLIVAHAGSSTVRSHRFQVEPGPVVTLVAHETITVPCVPRQLIPSDLDGDSLTDSLLLCNDGLTLRMIYARADRLVLHPLMRTALHAVERCVTGILSGGGDFLCWTSKPAATTLIRRP